MKMFIYRYLPILLILLAISPAHAEDMRELQIQAAEALLQKAAAEKESALEQAASSMAAITRDRDALEQAIRKSESAIKNLTKEIHTLQAKEMALEKQEKELADKLATSDSVVRELVGVIRVNAKDIDALIARNPQTALASDGNEEQTGFLADIAGQSLFPGMEDIDRMIEMVRAQIRTSGTVQLTRGPIIDRAGNTVTADLLIIGNFTAAYRSGDEVGFLNYSPAGRKLFALSKLPPSRLQKQLKSYMAGKSEAVPMDITRGGALSRLTHELSLWEQIPKGGMLIWPILAILVVGVLIVIERVIFLVRRRMDGDELTRSIESFALAQDWASCKKACARMIGKPVARVMAAGIECCHMQRESMENALQEAILREVPVMERFLSTLGMLAAIAPLLGLLGTVTGMIDTFQVITLHGTGDPRMMSGGISEALVTTMLGLSVAIPIMLAHTLLNREVDKRIGQMEEKAVALVNIVFKSRDVNP
ncbi:MAG: MotA/TolQ/ExbB proton channel family protein [Proteobacteria bacterium]|nr:MotA/TolQ/ExbB proton channel family protein [Pseudomonadota bacterium]MBU1641540.1 MotA/TolQ/ExbB proton channel family protein [Pseudomonadota bacterium]